MSHANSNGEERAATTAPARHEFPADFRPDEDSALALLRHPGLAPELLEKLSKSGAAAKSRKVKLGIVMHAKTPRHVSRSLLRGLYTFDLMLVALAPAVAGDLKIAAEDTMTKRLESIPLGERLSLARRASGKIAGALLLDSEPQVIAAALENPHLTEARITRALEQSEASPRFVLAVCVHSKWSLRRDIRIALLRNGNTPAGYAVEFAKSLPRDLRKEILANSKLQDDIKQILLTTI